MAFYFETSSINFLLNNLDDSEIILLRDGLKLVGDGKLCLSPIPLLCFDRVMDKSYRNNNTIPHNPLRFDRGYRKRCRKNKGTGRAASSCILF